MQTEPDDEAGHASGITEWDLEGILHWDPDDCGPRGYAGPGANSALPLRKAFSSEVFQRTEAAKTSMEYAEEGEAGHVVSRTHGPLMVLHCEA